MEDDLPKSAGQHEEHEGRYRALIEKAPTAIFEIDYRGPRFVRVNDAMCKLTGYSRQELLSFNPRDLLGAESRALLADRAKRRLDGEPISEKVDFGIRKKDGSIVYVSMDISFSEENPHRALVIGHNITERKRIENALREAEGLLRLILETSRDAIVLWNMQTDTYDYVSPSVESLTGYLPEQYMGMDRATASAMVHPDDLSALLDGFRESEETGKAEAEYRQRVKSGDYKWLSNHMSVVKDSSGRPLYRISNIRDMTGRRQSEEALAQAVQRLSAHMDNSPLAVVEFDAQFRVTRWSKEAERMFGWTCEEIIGRSISEVKWVYDDDIVKVAQVTEGFLTMTQPRGLSVNRNYRKDGSVIWCEWYNSSICDSSGNLTSVLSQVLDITDRKKAEEDLSQYARDLEAANRELEAFSYSVSHDLRAPLRAIEGFSEVVLADYEERLDENGRAHLKRIVRASARMSQLIEDLLRLSRVGRMDFENEKVSLSRMVKSIGERLAVQNPGRLVEFIIAPKVEARGDRRLLDILLRNLVENAWKFSEKRKPARIEFGVGSERSGKVYFVRDNGVGFDMKYADQLFKPFHRLHSERDFSGSGIGLALAHRIVARHGGRLWAESEPDKGATFFFTLGSV